MALVCCAQSWGKLTFIELNCRHGVGTATDTVGLKKKYPLSNNQLLVIFFACLSQFSCLMIYTVFLSLWIRDYILQPRQLNRVASKTKGLFQVHFEPTFNGKIYIYIKGLETAFYLQGAAWKDQNALRLQNICVYSSEFL